jgi:membrane protein YdbS with pleckstrin-like domain/transcription elongation factor Elf1
MSNAESKSIECPYCHYHFPGRQETWEKAKMNNGKLRCKECGNAFEIRIEPLKVEQKNDSSTQTTSVKKDVEPIIQEDNTKNIICPSCGHTYSARPDMWEKIKSVNGKLRCAKCKTTFQVPLGEVAKEQIFDNGIPFADEAESLVQSSSNETGERQCPFCSELISTTASKCSHCGEWLTQKCPYCKEEIPADAIKCKHCGEMIKSNGGHISMTNIPKVTKVVSKNNIPSKFQEYINSEETILYASTPSKGVLIIQLIIAAFIGLLLALPISFHIAHTIFVLIVNILLFGIIIGGIIGLIQTLRWQHSYYIITDKRTIESKGIFNVIVAIIPNKNIQMLHVNTGIIDRVLGLNTLEISSACVPYFGRNIKFNGISNVWTAVNVYDF